MNQNHLCQESNQTQGFDNSTYMIQDNYNGYMNAEQYATNQYFCDYQNVSNYHVVDYANHIEM